MPQRRRSSREVEAKFAAPTPARARRILAALGVPRGSTGRDERTRDLYLDTPRLDLLAAGFGYRLRTLPDGSCEATAKGIEAADAHGVLDREERTVRLAAVPDDPSRLPQGALRRLIERACAGRPLEPLARVHGRRRTWRLRPGAGLDVLVAHDRVTVEARRARARLAEVEVELLSGRRADFEAWLRERARAARARPTRSGKLERTLRLARVRLPSPARRAAARLALRPTAGPATPAAEALAQALGRLATAVGRALDGARRGSVEGLHDVRTVSRRLRALLGAFRPEVPGRAKRRLRRLLDGVRRAAGPVRDLDVLRATIEGAPTTRADAGARALRGVLAARRAAALGAARETLARAPLAALPERVADLAAEVLSRPSPALAVVGAARLPGATERALARAGALGGPAAEAAAPALHALRIAVKRARYAAEAFAPAFGRPVEAWGEALRALQDALGRVQDAEVARPALASLAAGVGGRAERAEAARTAAVAAEAAEAAARDARAALEGLLDAALGRRALRRAFGHLAKRAVAAVRAS